MATTGLGFIEEQEELDATNSLPLKRWPTQQDWDTHRVRIRQLYWEEDRNLKEVTAIMERDHGFKAT
jgi:hypothetical protein